MVRTFSIVGGMLVISSIGARLNKAYETFWEKFWTILGFFLSLVLIIIYFDTLIEYFKILESFLLLNYTLGV